jgi:hypothetical protein
MLSFDEYREVVSSLPFGKKVGKNVYVLWPDLKEAAPTLGRLIEPLGNTGETTLIKFFLDHYKVSFLQYPDFFTHPHPALHSSETVNLTNGKRRTIDYRKQKNPPVLHRKETMISPARPEYEEWKSLTEQLEEEGLYEDPKKIGFKEYWEGLLRSKGLVYDGHRLSTCDPEDKASDTESMRIDRHKTAMSRADFSRPVQLLLKHKLITKEMSFFDYGCGYGDDVRALSYNGYRAAGWDPVYFTEGNPQEAEVVNRC